MEEDKIKNILWKLPYSEERYLLADICKEIKEKIKDLNFEWEIGVGTDSQIRGSKVFFTTVICIYQKSKGGTYYYINDIMPKKSFGTGNNQVLRMYEEVKKTLEVASILEIETNRKPMVHVDASKSHKKAFTSSFSEQLKGYVVSSGFECILKPDSYVASCIADRHSKKS